MPTLNMLKEWEDSAAEAELASHLRAFVVLPGSELSRKRRLVNDREAFCLVEDARRAYRLSQTNEPIC